MLVSRLRPCGNILFNIIGEKVCLVTLIVMLLLALLADKKTFASDSENGAWRQQILQGWVQTLLQHNHRQFFHVLPEPPREEQPAQGGSATTPAHDPPPLPPPGRVQDIMDALPQPPQFDQRGRDQAGFRDTPVWLTTSGIHRFVGDAKDAGMSYSDLADIIPAACEKYHSLGSRVYWWLKTLHKDVVTHSVLIRCKIRSSDK